VCLLLAHFNLQNKIGEKDNKYFQPVVDAAKKFRGKDFGVGDIDEDNVVNIVLPWSPLWLLPDSSAYYYYNDGSFPVPPCWKVSRFYVMKDRIQISQAQLDELTNIKTDREKGTDGRMPCTFSNLQKDILTGDITFNPMEYEMKGHDDGKPRTEDERRAIKERKRRMDIFRRRLAGEAVYDSDGTGNLIFSNFVLLISCSLVALYVVN